MSDYNRSVQDLDEAQKMNAYYNWLHSRSDEKQRRRSKNPRAQHRLHRLAYSVIYPLSLPQSPSKEEIVIPPEPQQQEPQEILQPQEGGGGELEQITTIDQSRIVAPDDLTAEQFLSLLQNNCPYMKYSQLAPMSKQSNYTQDFTPRPAIPGSELIVPQFSYKNQQAPMYLQTSSRSDYRPQEMSARSRPNSDMKQPFQEQQQISYNSEYALKYQRANPSPSISMKPVQRATQLPAMDSYLSNYGNSFDMKYSLYFPPLERVRKNKNESTMKGLIQTNVNLSPESVYKQTYKMNSKGYLSGRQASVLDQTLFFSPSYPGQYNSVATTDFRPHKLERQSEPEDLMKLINIIQKKNK